MQQRKAIFVDVQTHRRFKVRAAKEGKTFNEMLLALMQQV